MAAHNPLEGTKTYLKLNGVFACSVMNIQRGITNEFESAKVNDCADPTGLPQEVSSPRAQVHTMTVSGTFSAGDRTLEVVARNGSLGSFEYWEEETTANGGQKEAFDAYIETFEKTSQERGFVNFSATLKIQGEPVVTAL